MAIYRNKKTNATLETPCKITGGDWEEVKESKKGRKKKDESEEKIGEEDSSEEGSGKEGGDAE